MLKLCVVAPEGARPPGSQTEYRGKRNHTKISILTKSIHLSLKKMLLCLQNDIDCNRSCNFSGAVGICT